MEWSERYDLHSHTTHSDGSLSVDELASNMASEGVQVWSLTDHDTISGWKEAKVSAAKHGIQFVPGVELTCDVELPWDEEILSQTGRDRSPTSWHLLAYFPYDPNPEGLRAFKDWLDPLQDDRVPRMLEMIELVNGFGMKIDVDDVLSRAQGSVGRPPVSYTHLTLPTIYSV